MRSQSVRPVSYTHLDVYKRQEAEGGDGQFRAAADLAAERRRVWRADRGCEIE